MPLFKININQQKVQKLDAKEQLEKTLQNLVEKNLREILDIHFLATEYTTSFGGRIDTLGIDKNGSPVIIEYKKTNNDNVINQALSYLKWLLDHKAEFEKLVNLKSPVTYNDQRLTYNGKFIETGKIDWNAPRVICIAQSYNKFDLDTVDILPIKIELLKYRIYNNDLLYIDTETYEKVNISTSGIFKRQEKPKKATLQQEYNLSDVLKSNWKDTKSLFDQLREKILALDTNITEKVNKFYIAYRLENNFCEIVPQAKGIAIHLDIPRNKLTVKDLKAEDVSKKGHHATGNVRLFISDAKEINSAMELIKQSYAYTL